MAAELQETTEKQQIAETVWDRLRGWIVRLVATRYRGISDTEWQQQNMIADLQRALAAKDEAIRALDTQVKERDAIIQINEVAIANLTLENERNFERWKAEIAVQTRRAAEATMSANGVVETGR